MQCSTIATCFCLTLVIVGCSHRRDGPAEVGTQEAAFGTRFLSVGERAPRPLEGLTDVRHVTVADIDGDGLVDVLAGRAAAAAVIAWGSVQTGVPATTEIPLGVAGVYTGVIDVDRDGDLDLLLPVDASESFSVWLQVSPRVFERRAALSEMAGSVAAIAVADIDGNGIDDVAVARQGANLVLLGNGAGGFVNASARLPFDVRASTSVAIGNLLGGALPDLVFAGSDSIAILRNDGAAFADVTGATIGAPNWSVSDLAIGDIDADGDADLMVRASSACHWLRGDGGGGLQLAQTLGGLSGQGPMELVDEEGDGDLDLAVARSISSVQLFRFDAVQQAFVAAPGGTTPELDYVQGVAAWSDLDGDARPDLIVQDDLEVLWNVAGAGAYLLDRVPETPAYYVGTAGAAAMVAGDFDQDGDVDLMSGWFDTGGQFGVLYRNDGAGQFTTEASLAVVPSAVADVNADGLPDLLASSWYPGDGQGGFGSAQPWPVAGGPYVGDFDGDGVDEVLLIGQGMATLLEATNAGPVPLSSVPIGAVASLVVADVDLDGIDDFVVVTGTTQTRLFLGTSTGLFVDRTDLLPTDLDVTAAVAVGDWEGDGDNDLIVARFLEEGSRLYARIYRNEGAVGFVIGESLISSEEPPLSLDGIVAADVDGDGRAEVFVQLQLTSPLHAAATARTEVFAAADASGAVQQVPAGLAGVDGAAPYAGFGSSVSSYGPKFVDLDGDGDLDLFGARTRINGLRDLTMQPRARWGGTIAVNGVDRAFVAGETALVFLGVTPTYAPLPGIGAGLVDPNGAFVAIADVAAGRGAFEVAFELPAVTIAGALPLYAQALLLGGDGALRGVTTRAKSLVW